MLQAIVYESNTGFTEKYATMLGASTKLPVYSTAQAKRVLKRKSTVIFLSWINSGNVVGVEKIKKRYDLYAVGAVGIMPSSPEREAGLVTRHELCVPVFTLRGGVDLEKLRGTKRLALKILAENVRSKNENDPKSEIDEVIEGLENGCDYVSDAEMEPLAAWVKDQIEAE